MKNIFFACIAFLSLTPGFGQQTLVRKMSSYNIGAQYSHEFVLGGYVHVREWEL